jgi:hypothetical protein
MNSLSDPFKQGSSMLWSLVQPVAFAMLGTTILVQLLAVDGVVANAPPNPYMVHKETPDETNNEKATGALLNVLVIIGAVTCSTFGMVALIYFRCFRVRGRRWWWCSSSLFALKCLPSITCPRRRLCVHSLLLPLLLRPQLTTASTNPQLTNPLVTASTNQAIKCLLMMSCGSTFLFTGSFIAIQILAKHHVSTDAVTFIFVM